MQQGWELHCRACGTALNPTAPAPAPTSAPAPSPAPGAPARKPDTGLAELLLLLGAVVSALQAVVALAVVSFLGGADLLPWFGGFGAILALIGLTAVVIGAGAAIAGLHARRRVQEGKLHDGGMVALVAGAVSIVLGNAFGGLLLLAGGFLAYTAQ
jgi:hypothetical protein